MRQQMHRASGSRALASSLMDASAPHKAITRVKVGTSKRVVTLALHGILMPATTVVRVHYDVRVLEWYLELSMDEGVIRVTA